MALLKTGSRGEFRNLLSAIKQAVLQKRRFVVFPKNKFKYYSLMKMLVRDGFILDFEERGEILLVYLKNSEFKQHGLSFGNYQSPFTNIRAIKRFQRRGIIKARDICYYTRVRGPFESFFISTDQGIIKNTDVAKKFSGGTPLFTIK
jgi:ribosomal protein S8